MFKYLFKRPMLLSGIICCFIAFAAFYSKKLIFISGIGLALLLGFLVLKSQKHLVAFAMVFIMLISSLYTCGKTESFSIYSSTEEHCRLTVCNINYESEEYSLAEVEVLKGETLEKGTKLSVIYEPMELAIGDIIEADMKISAVTDEKYKKSYYSKSIYLTASMSGIVKENKRDLVLNAVGKTRDYIKTTLFSFMGYNEAATLCALIFGENGYFTDEFYENVKRSGVSHVMVVSGMHLAILVSCFLYFTNKIFYNRYFKAVSMAAVVLLMITLCGFTMSMLRAGVTYILMALALILKRDSTPENTLGAAVTLILTVSPFAVLSLGFQLSVLSTFGILVIALPITSYVRDNEIIKSKTVLALFASVLTSFSATLLTLPVLIYNYEEISVVSIFTNLLITNAVTAALWIGILGLIANLVFPFLAKVILYFGEIAIKYINYCINKIGSLSFAVIDVPKITALFTVILVLVIFWILLACKVRRDMLKLKEMREKIIKEGGKVLKWQ